MKWQKCRTLSGDPCSTFPMLNSNHERINIISTVHSISVRDLPMLYLGMRCFGPHTLF